MRFMTIWKRIMIYTVLLEWTSGYAMVVHGRPKTPKNTSFLGGHPAPRGRTSPIF